MVNRTRGPSSGISPNRSGRRLRDSSGAVDIVCHQKPLSREKWTGCRCDRYTSTDD